ncbi:archease [Chloroflexota bacterium]
MEKEFEILEHTADIGIIAYGSNINEAFVNAAKGMFSLITELGDVEETEQREIEIEATDPESLLVAWLNELIFLFDTENLLFKRFNITQLTDTRLKAAAYGEKADLSRHSIKRGIKAATYHMLSIEKNDGVKATVVFDV